MKSITVNGTKYEVGKSDNPSKMYDVFRENKYLFSFGHPDYQNYKDYFGEYPETIHGDKTRQKNYIKRHMGIMSNGVPAPTIQESPAYFSMRFLWGYDPLRKNSRKIQ